MEKIKSGGTILLRAALIIFLTFMISTAAQYIFVYSCIEEISVSTLNGLFTFFYLLIFNSMVIALNSNDISAQLKLVENVKNAKKFSSIKFVFSTANFYIETALILMVSYFLPYGFVTAAIFHNVEMTDLEKKLYTFLVILPVMVVIDFFAHVVVAKTWYHEIDQIISSAQNNDGGGVIATLKRVVYVALIYFAVSMVLPWFVPFFDAVWTVSNGKIVWIGALLILFAALTVIVAYVLRAILKRKVFITKLKNYCKDNSIQITNINRIYISIFVSCGGANFTIEKDGKKYDCKLISGIFPGTPIIFFHKGNGVKRISVRLLRMELFSKLKEFTFSFEGEGKKILIVVPIPKMIYVSIRGSKPSIADTGEKLGEYTIYNSSGFLSSLDRNCL